MKVLQINSFFSVGGPPRIMNGIYDTLKENGSECKIAAAREKMVVPEDSYRIGTDVSVKINALKARLFDNEGFNAKKATGKLIEYIKEYDPDLIQLHNLHGYYMNIGLLFGFLKEFGKPVVWTLHDCWPMTGHCTHFDSIGCRKWKEKNCCDCPETKEYPACYWLDASAENLKRKTEIFTNVPDLTIVTVSDWLKGIVKDSLLASYPTEVIPNGIDLAAFKPTKGDIYQKLVSLNKKILLGVAQNWGKKKGLDDFIELSKNLPENCQLVLAGLTKDQKDRLPSNIIGFERTNHVSELAQIYTAASVYLNFSVEETMGMTTVEAMACGTPVIVYNRTAVPEVVDPSCGWIIAPGQFDCVRSIIDRLPFPNGYTDACLRQAGKYEKKKQYMEYIHLYNRILRNRHL